MGFACAQVFFIDPAAVQNASEVGVTAVDLYFKRKPDALSNKSGIQYPGVTVQMVATLNGIPLLSGSAMPTTRLPWSSVIVSSNAALKTRFRFANPVQCDTGAEYAIVVSFDGDEDFELWTNTKGWWLVGTTVASPGPTTTKYDGAFYEYISSVPYAAGTPGVTGNSSLVTTIARNPSSIANTDYIVTSWTPLSTEDLKFSVSVARYSFAGDFDLAAHASNASPVSAQIQGSSEFISVDPGTGEVILPLPAQRYEYALYDRYASSPQSVLAGEYCFQNTVFWPGGTATPATVSVTNGSATVTASNGVNWNSILGLGGPYYEYVVITSKDHRGANADSVAVRRVTQIVSNTVCVLDQPAPFTNTAAYFFRSPVAVVDQFDRSRIFGNTADLLVMKGSTSNASVRFANDCVEYVTVTANGTGYSNSDYVTITGYESVAGKVLGGYAARANVVTNANGSVTAVYLSNLGCGFTNSAAISVAVSNSTNHNSAGSGLALACNVGSTIRTEFLGLAGHGGHFRGCKFVNLEIGDVLPGVIVNNPPGTFYSADHRLPYYSTDDAATSFGRAYYCDNDLDTDQYPVTPFTVHRSWQLSKRRVLPSWSNEFYIPYANGSPCGALGGSTNGVSLPQSSNSSVVEVRTVSNNDFVALKVMPDVSTLTVTRYVANWDYTGENTNYGNSWAKGVETRVNFANGSTAEDLRVFATCYRPANTEIKMYAKLHNSHQDSETFDSKDWTLMQLDPNAGAVTYSSATDTNDQREITWRLPQYPNTALTLPGVVSAANGSAVLTGVGTSWQANATANVAAGSMVKLYSALFPNTYMVSVVSSVANGTSLTLVDPVSNSGLVGSGLKLDVISYNRQAFNNVLNENVARYYNSNNAAFDGFDTFAVKIVMLSQDGRVFPTLDDVRAVGVSA